MAVEADAFYLASLKMAQGIGNAKVIALQKEFKTAKEVWHRLSKGEKIHLLSAKEQATLTSFCKQNQNAPDILEEKCQKLKIKLCSFFDDDYPRLLQEIFSPPAILFYRGTLQKEELRLAMVGARRANPYGKNIATSLAKELAFNGITIVSGAARGIDTASHVGALETGRTIAVLGSGVDIAYPAENKKLLTTISEKGAVISEYYPNTYPRPEYFPERNRIISGLAQGTLVVEAAKKSGSLITAEMALSEGRDVYAVPGSIFSKESTGCNRLIQEGAKLVMNAHDILEDYQKSPKPPAKIKKIQLSEEEEKIYSVLHEGEALSIDEIIYRLRGEVGNIAFTLLQMELKGLVEENANHAYLKTMKERGL